MQFSTVTHTKRTKLKYYVSVIAQSNFAHRLFFSPAFSLSDKLIIDKLAGE